MSATKAAALTPLGIAVLALLAERPMHPYEMYQLLVQRREDWVVKVRPGSLYHTVARLAERELAEVTGTDRDGNRPERTQYAITPDGRTALVDRITELLATPVREYPSFPLALAEAHNLPADRAATLLRERIDALCDELTQLDAAAHAADANGIPRVYWLNVRYQHRVIAAQVEWLRELVDSIDDGSLQWLGPQLLDCTKSPHHSTLTESRTMA